MNKRIDKEKNILDIRFAKKNKNIIPIVPTPQKINGKYKLHLKYRYIIFFLEIFFHHLKF